MDFVAKSRVWQTFFLVNSHSGASLLESELGFEIVMQLADTGK
jgi:hypothetical protein